MASEIKSSTSNPCQISLEMLEIWKCSAQLKSSFLAWMSVEGLGAYPASQVGCPCSWSFSGTSKVCTPFWLWGHLLYREMMPWLLVARKPTCSKAWVNLPMRTWWNTAKDGAHLTHCQPPSCPWHPAGAKGRKAWVCCCILLLTSALVMQRLSFGLWLS